MNKLFQSKLVWLFTLLIVIIGCEKEHAIPFEEPPSIKRMIVTAQDIPKVTSTLLEKVGLTNGKDKFSANNADASDLEINWDKVMQLVDSTGNQTYVFNIEDKDGDPYTFFNLILKYNEFGDVHQPFLLKYSMGEAFIPEYLATGSLENFTGKVKKIRLGQNSNSYTGRNSAAPGGDIRSGVSGDEDGCDGSSVTSGGKTGSGGGDPNDGDQPPSGGLGLSCTTYVVTNTWYSQACGGGICEEPIVTGRNSSIYTVCVRESDAGEAASEGEDDCNPDEGEIPILGPDVLVIKLEDALKQDSTKLINIPCSEMAKWQKVGSFKPPVAVVNKMKSVESAGNFVLGKFDIQTLQNAAGKVVNIDYFPIKVDVLPTGFTAEQFLQHIRRNFNSFIDTQYSTFSPYDAVDTGVDEAQAWASNNPVGAIIHIEIPKDEGSVICSHSDANSWRFTTIKAPWDWTHPVSGTREFGFTENPDGSYYFYTRGVDRITQRLNEILGERKTFNGADNLWKSFQDGVQNFVNSNGGHGQKETPVIGRPNYDEIKDFLDGKKTIDEIGCKQ